MIILANWRILGRTENIDPKWDRAMKTMKDTKLKAKWDKVLTLDSKLPELRMSRPGMRPLVSQRHTNKKKQADKMACRGKKWD